MRNGIKRDLPKHYKLARVSLKMTQEQFAAKIGVGQSTLSKIEHGHSEGGAVDFIHLCRVLNQSGNVPAIERLSHFIWGTE